MAKLLAVYESNREAWKRLRARLESLGHKFERARNRSVALKLFARDGSDVIVCDDRIAEKNDYEFIREVRRIEPDTSIILTTEVDAFRQASNALSAGGSNCVDYVTQLTPPDKIEQLIQQAIATLIEGRT